MRKFYGAVSAIGLLMLVFTSTNSFGQSTYAKVYQILNANCQGSGCHSGGSGQAQSGLDFTLPDTTVYNLIIGKTPLNPRAAAKGQKLIDPGYPERSFLLRKIANCNEPDLALEPAEGLNMPNNRPAIPDSSMEIIRQWIIKAAPQTGVVVDEALIKAYYSGPHPPRLTPPAPPLECDGFQIHLGPLFFWPGQEMEFLKRWDMKNANGIEIKGLDNHMNAESHHFILRKYNNVNNVSQSLTVFDSAGMVNVGSTPFDQNKDYVMAWQNSIDIELPNGTAYRWPANTSLDLNYHIHNFDTLPLAAEVYLNVYTQPSGTAIAEMKSELVNQAFFTVNGTGGTAAADTTVLTYNVFNSSMNRSVWSITSHTHKYGREYKVWLEKPNGDKGDLIYDGDYNFNYTFNQGFFDWHHPPTHTFEPLLYLGNTQSDGSAVKGFVEEATYVSTQASDVHFGFTTNDEMMIIYVQYVDGPYTIPAQGYVNPRCPNVPYVNPCTAGAPADTAQLHSGDSIKTWHNGVAVLTSNNSAAASVGDTVTITTNGQTYTFVVTGNAPFSFHSGDVIMTSPNGIVFVNGVPVGYMPTNITGINEVTNSVVGFSVYPNPFEGHTTIDYMLTDNAAVSLEVYNLMGQRVETIVNNENQSSGGRSYQFNAGKASSGIYLVKLTVNGISTVKKISLL